MRSFEQYKRINENYVDTRKYRTKLFIKLRDKIVDFLLEVYPDCSTKMETGLIDSNVFITDSDGDIVLFVFFTYPVIRINKIHDYYSDILEYINSEIRINGEIRYFFKSYTDIDNTIKEKNYIMFELEKNRGDELTLLRSKDIENIKFSKEDFELMVYTKKFGL